MTFGAPHVLDVVARVTNAALKASWCHKWLVHRCLRPEQFAGRVYHTMTGAARYPICADVLNAAAPSTVFRASGTYLLPMAYPEGCPIHPAYPAGHAAIASVCVTVLKAFFLASFVIPNSVEARMAPQNYLIGLPACASPGSCSFWHNGQSPLCKGGVILDKRRIEN